MLKIKLAYVAFFTCSFIAGYLAGAGCKLFIWGIFVVLGAIPGVYLLNATETEENSG